MENRSGMMVDSYSKNFQDYKWVESLVHIGDQLIHWFEV